MYGAVAQLIERFHGMEEVQGLSPCSSTNIKNLLLRVGFLCLTLQSEEIAYATRATLLHALLILA